MNANPPNKTKESELEDRVEKLERVLNEMDDRIRKLEGRGKAAPAHHPS